MKFPDFDKIEASMQNLVAAQRNVVEASHVLTKAIVEKTIVESSDSSQNQSTGCILTG